VKGKYRVVKVGEKDKTLSDLLANIITIDSLEFYCSLSLKEKVNNILSLNKLVYQPTVFLQMNPKKRKRKNNIYRKKNKES
jgi:hypothetical protein